VGCKRRDVIAAAAGATLVAVAIALPRLNFEAFTPMTGGGGTADTAPIFGWWLPHAGWGTPAAVLIGVAAIGWGPIVARRLSWRSLTLTVWATSALWAFSLSMIDGWQRGFAGRLTDPNEYLHQVPTVTDIGAAVRGFAGRILDYQPDSWVTHVSGHPPGALLSFVWLDRIGLGGGAWAGLLCLLAGSSVAAAVIVTVRAVSGEATARLVAPFVTVAPTAIWIAVSADGYFAGVAAWGIALLALAVRCTVRFPAAAAAASGLLLGWTVMLSYGLTLMALPAAAVLACASDWGSARRAVYVALPAALTVVAVFAVAGFWWFDGYILVQQRYWQGIASDRPFSYWGWANLAATVCAIGLGSVAGVARAFDGVAIRRRSGLHLLVLAALAAIVVADLSMLSKAETERIWLPFEVWLTAAGALLPVGSQRWWLSLNVIGALLLNHLVLTNW
jgi:hypothetical protein